MLLSRPLLAESLRSQAILLMLPLIPCLSDRRYTCCRCRCCRRRRFRLSLQPANQTDGRPAGRPASQLAWEPREHQASNFSTTPFQLVALQMSSLTGSVLLYSSCC